MYRTLLEDLESNGVDWRSTLETDLACHSDSESMAIFSEWARYGAPKHLPLVGGSNIRKRKSLGRGSSSAKSFPQGGPAEPDSLWQGDRKGVNPASLADSLRATT